MEQTQQARDLKFECFIDKLTRCNQPYNPAILEYEGQSLVSRPVATSYWLEILDSGWKHV